jgi:hypothetical protein
VEIERESEYEIETIKIKRYRKTGDEYLIKWLGYNKTENIWESEINLVNC